MAEKPNINKIAKRPTDLSHIFLIDWNDSGILEEIAVVAELPDGTICGVQVANLHQIDKARLKRIVVSQHANKYPLWELMSQARLSNGINALDYFHANFVKQKRPRGAKLSQDSLSSVSTKISDKMIGSDNSNPAEINLDQTSKMFNV